MEMMFSNVIINNSNYHIFFIRIFKMLKNKLFFLLKNKCKFVSNLVRKNFYILKTNDRVNKYLSLISFNIREIM